MARKGNPPSRVPTGDYEVGFGRPPKHSRFKPGQSGNPKGRPRGTADLNSHIEAALQEKVTITEGGRRRTITKGSAVAKQLVNKAAAGDLRATRILLPHQKPAGASARQIAPRPVTEAATSQNSTPAIDYSKLTTAEMQTLYEAARILEGHVNERPQPHRPPSDPVNPSTEIE